MNKLPVIDISGLPDPTERQLVAEQIKQAVNVCGFFYIKGHDLNSSLIEAIRHQQRRFFEYPAEQKARISINQYNRGYLASGMAKMHGAKNHDQKEVFFWGAELDTEHPYVVEQIPLCGPNQWPDFAPKFEPTISSYSAAIKSTGDKLLEAIALSQGAPPDFFRQHYSDPMLRGQLIRYPQTTGDLEQFGVAPHTDFGCITLLLQETKGLEVLIGDEWIKAPPIEDTLVINIGDLLERWSNSRLPSTRHRVRNENSAARYSIAMFHDPSPVAQIDPLDFSTPTGQPAYEPVTAAEYIHGRNTGAFSHYVKAPST